jgi:hypothetical protein
MSARTAVNMSAIYIQHVNDPSYYYGDDRWVLGRKRARQFAQTHDAISFCIDRELGFAQVHVCFGPGAADVLIPVTSDMPVAHGSSAETGVWE